MAELTHTDIVAVLKKEKGYLAAHFGVMEIGLFGSFVRGSQKNDSDIDLLVQLEQPSFDSLAGLYLYLEKKFDRKVEIIRKSEKLSPRFIQRIATEIIYA